jgi:3-oxoadipate enol-lactonase
LCALLDQISLPGGLGPLSRVDVPALVVAQDGDPIHPVEVAERLAATLPDARLEVLPPGGVLWRDRLGLRSVISSFLP